MALLKTPAITLKSRKWGEADRIVTFYTLRFGKLRGVARGARRVKSRFGSALEPFVHVDLNLFEKGNDPLYRITQADIRESYAVLREDLALMSAAARLANLVDAVSGEGDAGTPIFETLLEGLRALSSTDDPALVALVYQIRLLGHTGFRPQTDHCAACGKPYGAAMRFAPASGGLVCAACERRIDRCLPLSPGSLVFIQQALRLKPDVLGRLKAAGQVRAELEAAIDAYVTVVAGRRLPPADFLAAESPAPSYSIGN
jgi:DNA repair protein RecO (recombination protein O)